MKKNSWHLYPNSTLDIQNDIVQLDWFQYIVEDYCDVRLLLLHLNYSHLQIGRYH